MAQIGGGGDFRLPEGILAALPSDPYEQLDLARRITASAVASRTAALELETARLRRAVADKDAAALEFESKLAESESRLRLALEENAKLAKERDELAQTSKKLAKDLQKLEAFKRHLMQSLRDDNSSSVQETVDIQTCEPSVTKAPTSIVHESLPVPRDPAATAKFSITPYITPRLTPNATPKVASGAASPTNGRIEIRGAMTPWLASSKQSSAANSPPRRHPLPGRGARIDGKEFFRQARTRLSYEQFGAFLTNIKELNAHKQSREDTLKKAEEIFGLDNRDLFASFQSLLSRGMP